MFVLLNKTWISRSTSAFLLFVILFNNIIFPSKAFALTAGPSQPEFSSFDSASNSEMVNMFTGDFSYNIPLMDVDGYPINISYNASPGMDQEASWVGLGWNINSGAINRGMRGLPDDFNGEEIKREINIEDAKAWGVGIGSGVEIVGLSSASVSKGIGVTKSNYAGVGIEFYFEPTLALSVGKHQHGSLTAGLGVKMSTTEGVNITPQLGIGGKLKSSKAIGTIGLNLGASYNSRDGLKATNYGVGISYARGKRLGQRVTSPSQGNKGTGFGFSTSATIPTSSQGFLPQITNSMKSQSYSLDFKLGGDACVTAGFGYIRGYYSQNGLASRDITLQGYGYLNSQNGDRQALQDFSREKDGMMYPETPNLPIPNYTYDMFYASAQGMEMAFRPHRNDVGMVYDNPSSESSFGIGTSAEVMVGPDVNIGTNVNTHWSDGNSGRWDENNDMLNSAAFTNSAADYEAAYLKVAGEKTSDDNTFLTSIMGEKPVKVQLTSISNLDWKATTNLIDNSGNLQTLPTNFKKSKRAVRNNFVSTLYAGEADYAAIDKNIVSYSPLNITSFNSANFGNVVNMSNDAIPYGELNSSAINYSSTRFSYANQKASHISELIVTNPTGSRYVYGIPVYNRLQKEAMFNISGSGQTHGNATYGLISHSATDASKDNAKGLDHFYEKNTVPDYVHSYLLTELLSSDYVDRTGNGPSQDDYGDYTKFNYSFVSGGYQWRIPYELNKAAFNQGFLSDKNDDKASYVFGTKDLWLPHSIETKNYIAFFVLDQTPRLDGYGVASESGGRSLTASQNSLKQIRLYAKKNLVANGINAATPIKVINFEYDYSLCPGIPSNINTVNAGSSVLVSNIPTNGKLTLKKIYFTYGNSNKGSLLPYTFTYCNGNYTNTNDNPTYDPSSIDKWGYYQKNQTGNTNNLDFPYTRQDKATADVNNARAWCLTEIKTPAGSKINVTYEADDYAYVQNKEAGQMFKISGASSSTSGGAGVPTLYGNDYMIIDLSSSGADGVLLNTANAVDLVKAKYFKDLTKIYIKACVQLTANNYEFVPLYADIEDVYISNSSTYPSGSNTYYNAIIKLRKVGINDDGSNTQINPIVKAAFQLGRMYLPGIVFPGSNTTGTDETIIKGLVTLVQDMKSMFSGINRALYNRNVAKIFDPARSVVRLYNPTGKKLGGGSRVKTIQIDDNWNALTGETSSVYGQEYSYVTQRNGVDISSGVASYEPLNGGDENSNRKPIDFTIKRVMAPNDEYFQEEPLGESFFPDPLVGYSKVTVKNLDRSAQNIKKHATGKTEYEFFTAKDFPVFAERTTLQKQSVKPSLVKNLLNFGSTDKLYMSQGYVIRTNDMHGKPRGKKNYAEDAISPYSGITYYYKTKAGTTNQLDNTVSVIDPTNNVANKQIGQTTDMVTDSRFAESNMWGAGVAVNVNLATCTFYVPLVFIWPSFSHERREFRSIATTKVINQYGLIDYVEAFDNNSTVKTNNLLYDDETGEVILTSTNNDFDQPVYNLKYPAYWAHNGMANAYKNGGISINANGIFINSSGAISGTYFVPGDEVLVKESPANIYTQTWVVLDQTTNTRYLVKNDGAKYTTTTAAANINLKITRSGRRNMQELPMSTLTSLGNPLVANKLKVDATTKVLNSSAVEYSDKWQMVFGTSGTTPAYCNCIRTSYYSAERAFMAELLFNPTVLSFLRSVSPSTSPPMNDFNGNGVTVFGPIYTPPSTYSSPVIQTFLQSFPNHLSNMNNPSTQPISLKLTKYQDGVFDKLKIEFVGQNLGTFTNGNNFYLEFYQKHWTNMNLNSSYLNNWVAMTTLALTYCNGGVCSYDLISDLCGYKTLLYYWWALGRFSFTGYLPDGNVNINLPGYLVNVESNQISSWGWGADFIQAFTNDGANFMTMNGLPANNVVNRVNCTSGPLVYCQCGRLIADVVNPYVENIRGNWRPKSEYSYLTARDNSNNSVKLDGAFTAFKPFYDQRSSTNWLPVYNSGRTWDYSSVKPYDNWIKNSETQSVNQQGNVLQVNDALNRRSASLYGYNNTLAIAMASNAYYNEIGFDSFEDYDYLYKECTNNCTNDPGGYSGHFNFYNNKYNLTRLASHTGRYSIAVGPGASNLPNKLVMSRKLNNPAPTGGTDAVPYTLKALDNYGQFGPFYSLPNSQKFVLSIWTREINTENFYTITSPQVSIYNDAGVKIKIGSTNIPFTAQKKSPIINGWQKLECEFDIPANQVSGTNMDIELLNFHSVNTYLFDDLRIHPFNASMKTMVYDPQSLRLMAEHDDRNYATIYEYDDEGTLVRVKKETEKGIYTVKETRSGLKK